MMATLFDGKCLGGDDTLIWENVGTGTGTFSVNKYSMSVTAGQYFIRRGRHITPYFSGKSQDIEVTFDQFAPQTGVTKMAGYYTSSATSPFNTVYDGFWVESDGTTVRLKVSRAGTEVANIPWTSWDNYQQISTYNWNNFTVIKFDFLWLGGTELRVFIKTPTGFVLAHTYKHASAVSDVFIQSPQQSIRYEIRSSSGSGSMRAICSAVASEGSYNENGKPLVLYNKTAVVANAAGTIYALKGVKKTAAFRETAVSVTAAAVANIATSDVGMLMVILNPTLSAPLTYANNSRVSEGTATNQTVTAGTGRVLSAVPAGTTGAGFNLNDSILLNIGMSAADVSDEIVLAYMSTSANQSVYGALTVKEF
jgi:hypothetical protein